MSLLLPSCCRERIRLSVVRSSSFHAVALLLIGFCVQDLIAAACRCRERDQEIRLAQRKKLTDGIRTSPREDQIRERKEIFEIILHIFKLYVAFAAVQRIIQMALAAQVNDPEFFQKRIQSTAKCVVDRD